MNELLGPALHALGHFVQNVSGFVYPAPLLGYRAVFFAQCQPEAERTVAYSHFGCRLQTLSFELLEQCTPGLGALPVAENTSHQNFATALETSNQTHHTTTLDI